MSFTDQGRAQIAAAIAEAELATTGEIVCVVNDQQHRYPATGLTVAALAAFAIPLVMVTLGFDFARLVPWRDWSTGDIATDMARAIEAYAVVQILIFVIVAALTVWTGLGAKLTPHAIKRDRVHAEALSQFRARGLGRTRASTGVLIYVAMPDHIAEVVADQGIFAKVAPEHWGATVAALVAGLKAGDPARGFVDAVRLAGMVLAEHFPPDPNGNPNELPDRLIEL